MQEGTEQRTEKPRRRWRGPALKLGIPAVLILGITGFSQGWWWQVWDRAGLTCGSDFSQTDPSVLDGLWTGWEDPQSEDTEPFREDIEDLAEHFGYEPVAVVPHLAEIELHGEMGTRSIDAEATEQGLRLGFSPAGTGEIDDRSQQAMLDSTTGEPLWLWGSHEGSASRSMVSGDRLMASSSFSRGTTFLAPDHSRTDITAVDLETGQLAGCGRVDGSPLVVARGDRGLTVDFETYNLFLSDDEQPDVGQTHIQQFSLPDVTTGFTETFPGVEPLDARYQDDRPDHQPLLVADEEMFLVHAYRFEDRGFNSALAAARYEDVDFIREQTPIIARSMETGEELWSHGEQDDHIAVVTTVSSALDGETGVLTAEIGEFELTEESGSAEYGGLGRSSVTFRMLDDQGETVWELPTADYGHRAPIRSEHYAQVLGDLLLVHTAPHVVTAVDLETGESLWTIDESEEEPQSLRLSQAVAMDGSIYIPGYERSYVVDAATGEQDEEAARSLIELFEERVYVSEFAPLGEDRILLGFEGGDHIILQRQQP